MVYSNGLNLQYIILAYKIQCFLTEKVPARGTFL